MNKKIEQKKAEIAKRMMPLEKQVVERAREKREKNGGVTPQKPAPKADFYLPALKAPAGFEVEENSPRVRREPVIITPPPVESTPGPTSQPKVGILTKAWNWLTGK